MEDGRSVYENHFLDWFFADRRKELLIWKLSEAESDTKHFGVNILSDGKYCNVRADISRLKSGFKVLFDMEYKHEDDNNNKKATHLLTEVIFNSYGFIQYVSSHSVISSLDEKGDIHQETQELAKPHFLNKMLHEFFYSIGQSRHNPQTWRDRLGGETAAPRDVRW